MLLKTIERKFGDINSFFISVFIFFIFLLMLFNVKNVAKKYKYFLYFFIFIDLLIIISIYSAKLYYIFNFGTVLRGADAIEPVIDKIFGME